MLLVCWLGAQIVSELNIVLWRILSFVIIVLRIIIIIIIIIIFIFLAFHFGVELDPASL